MNRTELERIAGKMVNTLTQKEAEALRDMLDDMPLVAMTELERAVYAMTLLRIFDVERNER